MKKKIFALMLCLLMVFSLAACGGTPDTPDTPDEGTDKTDPSQLEIVYMVGNLGDMSFSDSGARGIDELKTKYGFNTRIVETTPDSNKFEAFVLEVCDSGADFLIASSSYQEIIEKYAADYPDMRFVIFDVARNTPVAADNIFYIVYAQNEGSYLVGMIAAAMSESGVIGCVGGVQNPVIQDFMTGYMEGALAYNPDIKVSTAWVGDWRDAPKMLELCTAQHNSYGVDVFFPIAGGAGNGAFDAALNIGGIWTIGVDSDQYAIFEAAGNPYADVILTSMLKEVGNSFVWVFEDYLNGQEHWGTVRTLGIAENSVGYVNNEVLQANCPAEVIEAVEQAKEQIASGSLKVKSYFDFEDEQGYQDFANSIAP